MKITKEHAARLNDAFLAKPYELLTFLEKQIYEAHQALRGAEAHASRHITPATYRLWEDGRSPESTLKRRILAEELRRAIEAYEECHGRKP